MNKNSTSSLKQRDYLFDNYKAFLILLVVTGHFIEPCYQNNDFLNILKWLIVSFHMPAFILISGYFSKKALPLSVLIRKLAIPYVVYELVYYFFYILIIHKKTGIYLLYPKFSLWYLLALFVWRVITPYVRKIPHYMVISVILGLFIGYSDMPDNFLSLPRILFFYPFFLVGVNLSRETVTKLRCRTVQIISAIGIITFILLLTFGPFRQIYSSKIFYGRYNYDFLKQEPFEGILCRLICYITGMTLTFAIMALISERRTIYSYIGTHTMAIYLFHGLTYSFLKDCTPLLENVDTLPETVLLLTFCVLLTVVLSVPQLTTFTNKIASIPIPDFRTWIPDKYLSQTLSMAGRI
ncbi:MAG: acyltransferase family protein [Lachnospiraceae bacterium]